MIRYDLRCANGDEFEAWFGSISDYDAQAEKGLIECPICGDAHVSKAPMAPAVHTARSKASREDRAVTMAMAAKVREHIEENFDYVGDKFADEARKMHEGVAEERAIWGEATPEQARELAEEGVPVAPLPPELSPAPTKKNVN
ncbi:MAG: DUF1178 family protein [Pseudomonadota bacterium]